MNLVEAMRKTHYSVKCDNSEILLGTGPWMFTEEDLLRDDWEPKHKPKEIGVEFHEYHLLESRGYLAVLGKREVERDQEVLVRIFRDTCHQRMPLQAFVSRVFFFAGSIQLTELELIKNEEK
jgi:hypothetical protein